MTWDPGSAYGSRLDAAQQSAVPGTDLDQVIPDNAQAYRVMQFTACADPVMALNAKGRQHRLEQWIAVAHIAGAWSAG